MCAQLWLDRQGTQLAALPPVVEAPVVEAPVEAQQSDAVHSAIDTAASAAVDLNSIVTVTVRNATGSAVKVYCNHPATGAVTGGDWQVSATVGWVGELPGKRGTWVGFELFDSWDSASSKFLGDNDGTYRDPTTFVSTRMFTCERLCGLFVPIADVAPSTDFDSPPSPTSQLKKGAADSPRHISNSSSRQYRVRSCCRCSI